MRGKVINVGQLFNARYILCWDPSCKTWALDCKRFIRRFLAASPSLLEPPSLRCTRWDFGAWCITRAAIWRPVRWHSGAPSFLHDYISIFTGVNPLIRLHLSIIIAAYYYLAIIKAWYGRFFCFCFSKSRCQGKLTNKLDFSPGSCLAGISYKNGLF